MDNTSLGVNTVQNSPDVQNVVSSNASDAKIEASLAAGNIADAFREFEADSTATTDAEATSENVTAESANLAEDSEDASAQNVDSQTTPKEELPKGIKKRFAVLNARNERLSADYQTVLAEREKLAEANKIMQAELDRVMGKANLSDSEEDAIIESLGKTLSDLDGQIPERVAAKMAEIEQHASDVEAIETLSEQIATAHESYKELFTIRELGKFMQINEILDAAEAARLLGEHKAQRKRKQAPATAGIAGAGAKQTVKRWGYTGSDSIRDFFAQDARERTGRK